MPPLPFPMLLRLLALAVFMPARAAATPDFSATGAALQQPAEVRSVSGVLTTALSLAALRYDGPTTQMWTRAFNGSLPGPTLRVRAGDTVIVHLNNDLLANGADDFTHNTFHSPNTTNLHTHGLHISSNAPGDDVFTVVEPQTSYNYTYQIPADHAGGTFWYHPHHHGSTALQVGGGAAGVLIVEDEDGKVPAALLAMPELVLLTQHLPINTNPNLLSIAQDSADTLTTVDFKTDNADVVLVNGQHLPKLSVTAGKYTRLRVVHSSTASALSLTLDGCELQLLAKDGIYMPTAPRTVTALRLPPGGRCDVALLCRLPGTYSLESAAAQRRRHLLQGGGGPGGGGPGGGGPGGGGPGGGGPGGMGDIFVGNVATVEVVADATGSPDAELAPFQAVKPDYLADLYGLDNSAITTTHALTFRGGGNTCNINGNAFASAEASVDHQLEVGKVHEYSLQGTAGHPFHLHVNSFQLHEVEADPTGYMLQGDWHDVLMEEATVRFQTADFTGKAVIHCHILVHEDLGCMSSSLITGEDGTPPAVKSTYTEVTYNAAPNTPFTADPDADDAASTPRGLLTAAFAALLGAALAMAAAG